MFVKDHCAHVVFAPLVQAAARRDRLASRFPARRVIGIARFVKSFGIVGITR
jgi:hypothetical protein